MMRKRVSDSHQSHSGDVEDAARLKHGVMLQDYLKLQKEFLSTRKRLQVTKQKKDTLLAEVQFLRRRHRYLFNTESNKTEKEQELTQLQISSTQVKELAKDWNYCGNEANTKEPSSATDLNPIILLLGDVEEENGRKREVVQEPSRAEKELKSSINDKRVGKKKISSKIR